jgi:2-polyprenyl-3-methyl-5-hydroxy-6-metoxy-1,4-benzoquinol methylase
MMSTSQGIEIRRKRRGGAPGVEIAHGRRIVASGGEDVWNWSSPAGKMRLAKRIDLFVRALGLDGARKRVLELGCGTGLYTEQMAPFCRQLVATDISAAFLHEARSKGLPGHVTFEQQNLEAIEPTRLGAPFEAVYGCSVLHHLDLDETLPQLKPMLVPGADAAFSEPNLLNPQVQLMFSRFKWARRKWATSDTEMAFYPWELREIFTRHGFDVVELLPFDFMHPAIPAALLGVARRIDAALEHMPGLRFLGGSYFIHARLSESATRSR